MQDNEMEANDDSMMLVSSKINNNNNNSNNTSNNKSTKSHYQTVESRNKLMKAIKVIASLVVTVNVLICSVQFVEGAMNLPDGIENVLGFVPKSTFQCERDGYFGDIDNDCRIFHLCQKQVNPSGRTVSNANLI